MQEEEDAVASVDEDAERNVDEASEAIIDDAAVAIADDDADAIADGTGAPPPAVPERPHSSRGHAPIAPDPAAADDADGWLSDVSEAKDDAADAAAWADTSVEVREESRESPGDIG